MLGPESHVFEPLPDNESVRVLHLAPGQPDDEIFCFLFPCDLNKDHARSPSNPRPFETICVADAQSLGSPPKRYRFMLPIDTYIDENQGGQRPTEAELVKARTVVESRVSEVLPSTAHESHDEKTSTHSTERSTQHCERSSEAEAPDHFDIVVGSEELQTEHISGHEAQEGPSDVDGKEIGDDIWDLMQLMRLHQANGTLDKHVHRHPFQRFTALSYVWGSEEDPAYIIMNGDTKFWVTRNLYNALKSLRQPDMAHSLWIDAVCINQDDFAEKKIQIALMRRIYQQARKVIAYLPLTRDDMESMNRLMRKILQAGRQCQETIDSGPVSTDIGNGHYQETEHGEGKVEEAQNVNLGPKQALSDDDIQDASDANPDKKRFKIKNLPLKPTGTCIEDYDIPPEDDPAWLAWRRFFASPYFRRIWILQEYALAKDLYFQFGEAQGNADMMLLAMHYVRTMSRLFNGHYLGRGEDSEMSRAAVLGWIGLETMTIERALVSTSVDHSSNQKLADKLQTGLSFDATDPRDKVFAVLGLAADSDEFRDYVSYEKEDTYDKVYQRFARVLINKGYCAQLLRMACKTPWTVKLPSWVADWSTSTAASLSSSISSNSKFHAGGKGYLDVFTDDDNKLSILGTTVDKIDFTTDAFIPFSKSTPINTGVLRVQDFFETFSTTASQVSNYLEQNFAEVMMDIFHAVSMLPDKLDLDSSRHDAASLKDLLLFRTLIVRLMQYMEIPNHEEVKVVIGAMPEDDRDYIQRVMANTIGRRFCVTKDRLIGLVPERAEVGDRLAVFIGAPVPFVLRKAGEAEIENGEFKLVGDAYLNELMQGEILDGVKEVQRVVLV